MQIERQYVGIMDAKRGVILQRSFAGVVRGKWIWVIWLVAGESGGREYRVYAQNYAERGSRRESQLAGRSWAYHTDILQKAEILLRKQSGGTNED